MAAGPPGRPRPPRRPGRATASRAAGLHPGDLGGVARAEKVLSGRGQGLERHPGRRPGRQQPLAPAGGQQQLPLPRPNEVAGWAAHRRQWKKLPRRAYRPCAAAGAAFVQAAVQPSGVGRIDGLSERAARSP